MCSQSSAAAAAGFLSIEQPLPRTFSASALQGSRPLRLAGGSGGGSRHSGAGRFSFWESMAASGALTSSRWQLSPQQQQPADVEPAREGFLGGGGGASSKKR